jgi:hypothetical protein
VSSARGRLAALALALCALLAVLVAFFFGRALFPGAALYRAVPQPAVLALGTLAKTFYLFLAFWMARLNASSFEPGSGSRRAWRLLTFGLLAFFLGQATIAVYQFALGIEVPFPSVADVFWLAGYPLLAAALLGFLRTYTESGFPIGSSAERTWLAAGVAVVAAAIEAPLLRPLVVEPAPWLAKLLNVSYPVLDIVLLVPTALLIRIALRFRGGAVWRVWAAILAGFVFICAADVLFAWFSQLGQSHLVDAVDGTYLLAYGCLGLGVLYQRELVVG